jgi:predicted dehydrogenase
MDNVQNLPIAAPKSGTAPGVLLASSSKTRAIVVFGAGHHARRIYIPGLLANKQLDGVKVVVVDLFEASPVIDEYIAENEYAERVTPHYLLRSFPHEFEQSVVAEKLLQTYDIMGVIISTDPQNHMQYATWALKHNLHVLMDKPISTYENVVGDVSAAERLYQDYADLMKLYVRSTSIFCLNTQRRYETGYQMVNELINEVRTRFNMPVTSIQVFYSDGLWIFPDEIMHQNVHPFNRGYGMLSHSAFHLLDAAWQLYSQGVIPAKAPDAMETFASATYPTGFIKNFGAKDYERVFKKPVTAHDDAYYLDKMAGFGEMDVLANFLLKQESTPVSGFTVNLMHNGFSRRSWPDPAKDLYKGNGRVKHQSYIIEQGPFQSIQIHNYQATHEHDIEDDGDTYELGGKNHFDINVFRNSNMFPAGEQCLRKYSSKEIDKLYATNSSKLSNELAKYIVIDEFIENCSKVNAGLETRDTVNMRNGLPTYEVPVKMMAAVYKSLALRQQGKNPVVEDTL